MARNETDWSKNGMENRLRTLWRDPGISTAAIGREFKLSKSAITGKAHRLGLPARPSPIKRNGSVMTKPARVIGKGSTLPPLQSLQAAG